MTFTDTLLAAIGERFPLDKKDAGEFAAMSANGMRFETSCYEARGLGHVSVMRGAGMLGLMKMDTLIVAPTERDMPLLSYDRIIAAGRDTLVLELYDTLLGECELGALSRLKSGAASLPDRDLGEHWYDGIKLPESLCKRGGKKLRADFDALASTYFSYYADVSLTAAVSGAEEKRRKTSEYLEGLLANGGPATDVFKKSLGEEKTSELFRRVLFGTTSD